jgi:23S rRNA C2498 (ribose-2'-O)-methylase RlmM
MGRSTTAPQRGDRHAPKASAQRGDGRAPKAAAVPQRGDRHAPKAPAQRGDGRAPKAAAVPQRGDRNTAKPGGVKPGGVKPGAAREHVVVTRPGFASVLRDELVERFGLAATIAAPAAVTVPLAATLPKRETTVFARQYLPRATPLASLEPTAVAADLVARLDVLTKRANRQSGRWTLHAFAVDDDDALAIATKIEKAALAAIGASLLRFAKRYVAPLDLTRDELAPSDLVVQVFVATPTSGWVSIASLASDVSPYVAGAKRMRHQSGAPSRSARKLLEALDVLGAAPEAGETAVDLGAAPGGWSFMLAGKGASVTAVDHAELDLPADDKRTKRIAHVVANGLTYAPPQPVDWLCCDMVIDARAAMRTLATWIAERRMRRFVVNVKLPTEGAWPLVAEALAVVEASGWPVRKVRHLYHDRHEVTLMGLRGD